MFHFPEDEARWLIGHLTLTAVCGDMLSGRAPVGLIGCQGGADLLVDEGVEADVRAPAEAALAHRAVVLPQEIVHLPCDGDKDTGCCLHSEHKENVNIVFLPSIINHILGSWLCIIYR